MLLILVICPTLVGQTSLPFLYQTCVEGREPTAEFEIENK